MTKHFKSKLFKSSFWKSYIWVSQRAKRFHKPGAEATLQHETLMHTLLNSFRHNCVNCSYAVIAPTYHIHLTHTCEVNQDEKNRHSAATLRPLNWFNAECAPSKFCSKATTACQLCTVVSIKAAHITITILLLCLKFSSHKLQEKKQRVPFFLLWNLSVVSK